MSPAAALAPGSASKDYKKESTAARILGSGMKQLPESQGQELDLIIS